FNKNNYKPKKKALLIGVNYYNTRNALKGCINDVNNISNFLVKHYNFKYQDMVILTDNNSNLMNIPIKSNILRAMNWLVKDAQPNDSLFFHFSGHGGRTPDLDGDEEDGFGQCIYPLDFKRNGHIADNQMHKIMVKPLKQGVKLTAIFDCCHSGTALNLPYVYSSKGLVKHKNLLKDTTVNSIGLISNASNGDFNGAYKNASYVCKRIANNKSKLQKEQIIKMKSSLADVISFSGCKDDEKSVDTSFNGVSIGAMSYALISVLSASPQQSYISLLISMRYYLKDHFQQKPQLSSSHPINVQHQFTI
ncbi:caspase family protein, partial [Ascoidea rubescens DSM 1968]